MKERPIMFSAAMVRAILDGRKTQTRRVMRTSHVGYRSFYAARTKRAVNSLTVERGPKAVPHE